MTKELTIRNGFIEDSEKKELLESEYEDLLKEEDPTCLFCYGKNFTLTKWLYGAMIENHFIPVFTDCFQCTNCKVHLMNTDQMNMFRKKAKYKFNQIKKSTLPLEQ